jgi:MFS superfamily sulfate permease-like transporter
MAKIDSGKVIGARGAWNDILSSVVVFLVALPLCLGIAIACGVPPTLGLITGIIGGIVASSMAGCPLQVSGPAAGLTALVFEIVERYGLPSLGIIVLFAGLFQVLAGFLKLGKWFRAVSPAVLHGMLAGIGVLLCASQFHVMLGYKPESSGLPNLITIPTVLIDACRNFGGEAHWVAGLLGVLTLTILIVWKQLHLEKKLHMPGALPAILVTTAVTYLLAPAVDYVSVPANILGSLSFTPAESLARIIDAPILLSALSLALIASAETLLSATAVDQLQSCTHPTKYDKELVAQGVGNVLCGIVGALPMTGVIARSTVNVQSGARTRLSGILHGVWLLVMVVVFPSLLNLIPTASLAALLIFTGIKLVDLGVVHKLKEYGRSEPGIYLATLTMVVATDLLTGVLVGVVLSLMRLVWSMSQLYVRVTQDESKQYVMSLKGTATFLGLPILADALEQVPAGVSLRLDFSRMVHIDHACLELLEGWDKRQRLSGGALSVDWVQLKSRFVSPADA